MSETTFRNKIKILLERTGGLVFRINDVPGTGLRYSDLIWIYRGSVLFIECKVVKNKTVEQAYNIKQKDVATPGQLVANYIIQQADALYVYAMFLEQSNETVIVFYEHADKVYSPVEAGDLTPTVVINLEDFIDFCVKHLNERASSLEMFKKAVLNR